MSDVERPGANVSTRWAEWRAALSIDAYERRFTEMDANGAAVHGEADFITALQPASVLDAGCGTGRVAIELARRGIDVVGVDLDDDMLVAARAKAPQVPWVTADLAVLDLGRVFDVVAMPGNVMIFCDPVARGPIVARCAAHLAEAGRLITGFSLERRRDAITVAEYDRACTAAGLELRARFSTWEGNPFVVGDASYAVSVHEAATDVIR